MRFKHVIAEPPAVLPGNLPRLPEEGDKEQQHEVGVDLRLEFEIPRVAFVALRRFPTLELESGVHLRTLQQDRPYERLDISRVQGLTDAQRATLQALGAMEDGRVARL